MFDWTDRAARLNEAGVKKAVGPNPHALAYSEWRRYFGNGAHTQDIDWVEYRYVSGCVVPVAVLETTFNREPMRDPSKIGLCRSEALRRLKEDGQYWLVTHIAITIGVPAYLVFGEPKHGEIVPRECSCDRFHICRLSDEHWQMRTPDEFKTWIFTLGQRDRAREVELLRERRAYEEYRKQQRRKAS